MEAKGVFDDLRYDEKTGEYSLVFKDKEKFNDFCNRIQYMVYVIETQSKELKNLKNGKGDKAKG